jgi:hypothetical protein
VVQKSFRTPENEFLKVDIWEKKMQDDINQFAYFLPLPFWMGFVVYLF